MTIIHKLLPDGGFVCGDTESRRTSYAYSTSSHAGYAAKGPQYAAKIAEKMIRQENLGIGIDPRVRVDYDARNWLTLEG